MKYLLLLLLNLLISPAFALCTAMGGSTLTIPAINLNRDSLPANSQISGDMTASDSPQVYCSVMDSHRYFGIGTTGSYVTTINGRRVYRTNVPGIGYAVGFAITNPTFAPSVTWIDGIQVVTGDANNRIVIDFQWYDGVTFSAKPTLALYKISNQLGSGALDLSGLIYTVLNVVDVSGKSYSVKTPLNVNLPTVTANTCAVSGLNTIAVNLPDLTNVKYLPSIGSTTGSTPFAIAINCPSATNLYITFTDNNNISQTGNILSLGSGSTAKGVSLQLAYQGSTISFGPDSVTPGNTGQLFLANLAGQRSFPFSVSYIRTGMLGAGSLSATATFTLSYQ